MAWGLPDVVPELVRVRIDDTGASGPAIIVRQRLRPCASSESYAFTTRVQPAGHGRVRIETTAVVPAALGDLPRLGHELALDDTFADLRLVTASARMTRLQIAWPAPCSAAGSQMLPRRPWRICTLRTTVTDDTTCWVEPPARGHGLAVRVEAKEERFSFAARLHSDAALQSASTTADLARDPTVGSGCTWTTWSAVSVPAPADRTRCREYRIGAGRYSWNWSLTVLPTRR